MNDGPWALAPKGNPVDPTVFLTPLLFEASLAITLPKIAFGFKVLTIHLILKKKKKKKVLTSLNLDFLFVKL